MDVFTGAYDQCDDTTKFGPPVYYFGNDIEFYRIGTRPEEICDDTIVGEHPVVFFQINLTRNEGITSVLGYGFIDVPMNPGSYDIDISTFRPVAGKNMGEIEYRMKDYYFGCAAKDFQYMKAALISPILAPKGSNKLSVGTRNGIVTEGSGSVRIRIRVLSLPEVGRHRNKRHNHKNSDRPIFHETISEVLSRVRRNKRERLMCNKFNSKVPETYDRSAIGTNTKEYDQNPRTGEILRRVRARKITRMTNDLV